MRRRRTVTWLEIVTRAWTSFLVLGRIVLGQRTNFDVIPGSLVYFGEIDRSLFTDFDGERSKNAGRYQENLEGSYSREHDHLKHYLKGSQRFIQREFDSSLDLPPNRRGRQGQQCRSRCAIIPDRDFCPTDIVEEIEANDDYNSYEYSKENSVEYSEENYYEEEDYEEYNDDGSKNRNKPRLTSSEIRGLSYEDEEDRVARRAKKRTKNVDDDKYGGGDGLYSVYPPVTRYAISRANGNSRRNTGEERNQVRNKVSARQRRRQRRLKHQGRLVRLRPPALEQEILVRWDRVVERGPYIGGDIVVPEGVLLRQPSSRYIKRTWPDAVVPYEMDPSLNSCRANAIFDAIDEIEERTCIRFVERTKEKNYVDIRLSPLGCSSYVGMIGGSQHLNLSTGCFSKFTVTHELMHAIGFDHEQSRKDRDKHIEIDFDNVVSAKEGQFELNPSFTGTGFPYDIKSIMHYSAFLFAKNKCEPTIYPVNDKVNLCDLGLGNGRGGMTNCDAAKVNSMYKCGRKYSKKCRMGKSS